MFIAGATAAAGLGSLLASAVAGMASGAVTQSPPKVSASFTPAVIGVGQTSSLTIKIPNPNASGSLSGISFTDTLPVGVVVDNPNGTNGTCGSASVETANPGSSTVSMTGGKGPRQGY
jgi:uncharacterized repeat protein (TIGR01451 family)